MSRVSDAFQRARQSGADAAPPGAAQAARPSEMPDREEVPWDFTTSRGESEEPASPPADPVPEESPELLRSGQAQPDDELAQLAQRLFLPGGSPTTTIRSVLFSAAGAEGASATVCAGAARALARQTKASVCVVDANLRAKTLDVLFGISNARGLSDLLLEDGPVASYLTRIHDNLWVMPAGTRCGEAQSQLTGALFEPRLEALLGAVDYVLIDASPTGASPDAGLLGAAADGVVLVIDATATRREAARHAAASLQATNVRVLGAVMTNRRYPIPEVVYRRL